MRQPLRSLQIAILVVGLLTSLLGLSAGCGAAAPEPQSQPGTEPPGNTATAPQAMATAAPQPTAAPGLVVGLNPEAAVIYAFTSGGIAFYLTPLREPIDITPEELKANPGALDGVALASVTVVEQLHEELPAGDYSFALGSKGTEVLLASADTTASFPAVLRVLRVPLFGRPSAQISPRQLCVVPSNNAGGGESSDEAQICALIDTPPTQEAQEKLLGGLGSLGAEAGSFDLVGAVPDIVGRGAVERCKQAVLQSSAGCNANLLVALTLKEDALPVPSELQGVAGAAGIGVFVVPEDVLDEEAYSDISLTEPVPGVKAGPYAAYDVVQANDKIIGDMGDIKIRRSAIALSREIGGKPEIFLPTHSIEGAGLMGTPLEPGVEDPPQEVIIANLWFRWFGRWRCVFPWKQCP